MRCRVPQDDEDEEGEDGEEADFDFGEEDEEDEEGEEGEAAAFDDDDADALEDDGADAPTSKRAKRRKGASGPLFQDASEFAHILEAAADEDEGVHPRLAAWEGGKRKKKRR